MPFIEWNETLSVNISEIDEQHKKLINIINNLHDSIDKGISFNEQLYIIQNLVDYAKTHFATEEKYMMQFNFPEYGFHRSHHDFFRKKIDDFFKKLIDTKENISVEILGFLKSWLINHIIGIDKKYTSFFHNNGLF